VPLRASGAHDVALAAPGHHDLAVSFSFDGSSGLDALALVAGTVPAGHGVSLSHETRVVGGQFATVHSLYLGLRHRWFSAQGRPARRGNDLTLLMDGEEAWAAVHADLTQATQSVLLATWWWESDFELLRDWYDHAYLTEPERRANTMLGILESLPATRRVLINEFWGSHDIFDWLNTDDAMAAYAETPGDGFEVMGQGNPATDVFWFEVPAFAFGDRVRAAQPETAARAFEAEAAIASEIPAREIDLTQWPVSVGVQIASYHQKFLVIDHGLAYIGGMNVKATDWDSSEHLVFDHRRLPFEATVADREEVMDKASEPDTGPRKDYLARVEGPAAQDAADVFRKRWSFQIAAGATFSENASAFTVETDLPEVPGGVTAQVTATLPAPLSEHAIAETWWNAIAEAERYILVEDQYWRMPMLQEHLIARMNAVPALQLVVITKPVDEWLDPGCEWTHTVHQDLLARFPGRYRTYQLRSFDTVVVSYGWDETESRFVDMDVHSKILIVDDVFLSVGSCNKNNRGLVYEGELNVAVWDAAWVRAARRRILANVLPAGAPATDDPATWIAQLDAAAAWNDAVYARWDDAGGDIDLGSLGDLDPLPVDFIPEGFVYSLGFRTPDDCFIEGVGPDNT
jgi:phosphatidylserine/phosphatidylglycerophosphate/cardiolipin synthase-like enzyme